MSDAVSALAGETYQGLVRVAEGGLCGMITLRADLGAAPVAKALKSVTGHSMPDPRGISGGADTGLQVAWMSPDELLILCDYATADGIVADLQAALSEQHHLAVNVSDARAVFTLSGAGWRDVLAKLTPADLTGLAPGEMRRSRLAQVASAFWMVSDDELRVVCFRSVARYVCDLLRVAAMPGGGVGYHEIDGA